MSLDRRTICRCTAPYRLHAERSAAHRRLSDRLCAVMGCTVLPCRFRAGEKAVLSCLPDFDAMGELEALLSAAGGQNRFALLPEIVRQFRLLELRDSGEGLCVFRCAREPDDESLRSLAKLLCARHSLLCGYV